MPQASLNVTRVIRADPAKVFQAWTDPESICKWWGPGATTCPEASVDLTVGGAIRIANEVEDGSIIWIEGQFEEINNPSRLIYSWTMGANMAEPTRVTVDFNDHPQRTELVITHERFASDQIRDAHLQGWYGCLDGLEALVSE